MEINVKRPVNRISPFMILLIVLIVAALGIGIFYFIHYTNDVNTMEAIDTTKYEIKLSREDYWINPHEAAGKPITDARESSLNQTTYVTPEGFTITSESAAWQKEALAAIYEELLNNQCGPELQYLKKIVLYAGPYDKFEALAGGEYSMEEAPVEVAVDFNALIDDRSHRFAYLTYGIINLYDMDNHANVLEISRTLAHEYGQSLYLPLFFRGGRQQRSPFGLLPGTGTFQLSGCNGIR